MTNLLVQTGYEGKFGAVWS